MTRIDPGLEGVPETLLWTLYHRALEARRPDGVLRDPAAVGLVDRIDYPFAERFGTGGLSQWQALRVLAFDREVRRFLTRHPDGTVVALGEGLETQFQRVDDGRVRWIGVDLPEAVEVRRRLLPDGARHRSVAASVLDEAWMEEVDTGRGVLLTAQGLLMYLDPAAVHRLVARCAERFPGAGLVFDAVPPWLASLLRRAPARDDAAWRPPPWTWTLDRGELRRIEAIPAILNLRIVPLPRGRGAVHGALLPVATRLPHIRTALLTVLAATFRTP